MVESLIEGLRKDGYRVTRARRTLLDILQAAKKPLCVPDIMRQLERKGFAVNKTTAYREISFFMERDFVSAVDFGDGAKRYELADEEHHHHFVCTTCDTVAELKIEDGLKKIVRKVARQTGARITDHAVEFFGICRSCASCA